MANRDFDQANLNNRLSGKNILLIGAGQTPGEGIGNGRATALLFAKAGASLTLVDYHEESLQETLKQVKAQGAEAIAVTADIKSRVDCENAVEACLKAFGSVDVLHNNVGVGTGDGRLLDTAEEAWDHIVDTNLKGAWLACRAVVPTMRAQRSGVITLISSVAAISNTPAVAYKTSKAGLNALVQSLALENAEYGIRANAVMPGMLDTPMAIESLAKARGISREELRRARLAAVPLKGVAGDAWDTAYASMFLASDEARYISGVVLPVDGGRSINIA